MILVGSQVRASQLPYHGPILSKIVIPGYSLPEYRYSMTCEVFGDRVEIEERRHNISYKTVKPVTLEGPIFETIEAVDKAPKSTNQGPTDAPSTLYMVHATHGTLVVPVVFNAEGTRFVTTEGSEAMILKFFLDSICK